MQAQLKQDLANIVSAEALFVLTDLCGLSPHDAIDSVIHAARSVKNQSLDRDTWKVGHWQQFWTGANATSCAWHRAWHVTGRHLRPRARALATRAAPSLSSSPVGDASSVVGGRVAGLPVATEFLSHPNHVVRLLCGAGAPRRP